MTMHGLPGQREVSGCLQLTEVGFRTNDRHPSKPSVQASHSQQESQCLSDDLSLLQLVSLQEAGPSPVAQIKKMHNKNHSKADAKKEVPLVSKEDTAVYREVSR